MASICIGFPFLEFLLQHFVLYYPSGNTDIDLFLSLHQVITQMGHIKLTATSDQWESSLHNGALILYTICWNSFENWIPIDFIS